jgi:hypothetical protein
MTWFTVFGDITGAGCGAGGGAGGGVGVGVGVGVGAAEFRGCLPKLCINRFTVFGDITEP